MVLFNDKPHAAAIAALQREVAALKQEVAGKAPKEQVDALDQRVGHLEALVGDEFSDFKNRTVEELEILKSQNGKLLGIAESIINTMQRASEIERATNLRRRLRNHETRIRKALESKAG